VSEKLFREMAEKIAHNVDSSFAGAVVIVPPDGGGEPISLLILDSTKDPIQFWSLIEARATANKNTLLSGRSGANNFNQAFPQRRG